MFRDKKYRLTINQQNFIKSNHNVGKLQVLQQSSFTKLQYKAYNKIVWIRSVPDDYKMFRMLILGLIVKIFATCNDFNQQRLNKLKQIIYSAKLYGLTEDKGIDKELLFKSIAINLNSLSDPQRSLSGIENAIVSLFNNAPFFDQIIMLSIAQKFQLDFIETTIELIQRWFEENLSLIIVWTDQNPQLQKDNQIFFQHRTQSLMRRSLNTQMEVMSQSGESGKQNFSSRSPLNARLKLLKTISVESASPTSKLSTAKKQLQKSQRNSVSRFESDNKCSKAKGSRLWNLLCCRSD